MNSTNRGSKGASRDCPERVQGEETSGETCALPGTKLKTASRRTAGTVRVEGEPCDRLAPASAIVRTVRPRSLLLQSTEGITTIMTCASDSQRSGVGGVSVCRATGFTKVGCSPALVAKVTK